MRAHSPFGQPQVALTYDALLIHAFHRSITNAPAP